MSKPKVRATRHLLLCIDPSTNDPGLWESGTHGAPWRRRPSTRVLNELLDTAFREAATGVDISICLRPLDVDQVEHANGLMRWRAFNVILCLHHYDTDFWAQIYSLTEVLRGDDAKRIGGGDGPVNVHRASYVRRFSDLKGVLEEYRSQLLERHCPISLFVRRGVSATEFAEPEELPAPTGADASFAAMAR